MSIVYLTGAFRRSQADFLAGLGVGVMLQPGSGYVASVEALGFPCWAADNGCYAQGEKFRLGRFLTWLDRVPLSRLLFAVAPDVFPDAEMTITRARPVLRTFRERGIRGAFVAQNDAEYTAIPWDEFDCLFLGGEDTWKLGPGARGVVLEARRRAKWVHMGRVNSERRLRYAHTIGCDSADGTYIKFRNRIGDGALDVAKWFRQGVLPYGLPR